MALTLTSSAFVNGRPIPRRFAGDGDDVSPPLAWDDVPAQTLEFALICDDPDAPTDEPWVHWLIYKIPGDVRQLAEGLPSAPELKSPPGALQGRNSWPSGRTIGYRGPAPPKKHGVHHYRFELFALDARLAVRSGLDIDGLRSAISEHVIAHTVLTGTYERP